MRPVAQDQRVGCCSRQRAIVFCWCEGSGTGAEFCARAFACQGSEGDGEVKEEEYGEISGVHGCFQRVVVGDWMPRKVVRNV